MTLVKISFMKPRYRTEYGYVPPLDVAKIKIILKQECIAVGSVPLALLRRVSSVCRKWGVSSVRESLLSGGSLSRGVSVYGSLCLGVSVVM